MPLDLLLATQPESRGFDLAELLARWALALAVCGATFTLMSLTSLLFSEPQRRDAYGLAVVSVLVNSTLVCWWMLMQRRLRLLDEPPHDAVFWVGLAALAIACVELLLLQRLGRWGESSDD